MLAGALGRSSDHLLSAVFLDYYAVIICLAFADGLSELPCTWEVTFTLHLQTLALVLSCDDSFIISIDQHLTDLLGPLPSLS